MEQKVILFDLDGTLTDSSEGIMNCAKLALSHYGVHIEDNAQLHPFIGPPLRYSFPRYGVPEDRVDEAIQIYRGQYQITGIFENEPYPGIIALLQRLQAEGHRLFVATSKPEGMSRRILEHLDMSRYFEKICGASMDGVRDSKDQVIAYLLEDIGPQAHILMIGDTKYDVIGAAAFQIPTIGVAWGFGTLQDMEEAGAAAIAHSMDELYELISKF